MKLEIIDGLKDEELQAVIERAQELLRDRDEKRKDKAREDAIAILAAAGLEPGDLKGTPKRKRTGVAVYKAGHSYQHPDDPTKVWKGTGVRPAWVKELEAKGRKPVEVAAA